MAHTGPVDSSTILELSVLETGDAAAVFAALADPARVRVLAVLADAERCVCDIQSATPMATNLLSYHLKTLREAGLVEGSRRGRFIDYRLTNGAADRIRAALAAAGFAASDDQPPGCAPECEVPAK
jgi:ArsR family transcriptional regulator